MRNCNDYHGFNGGRRKNHYDVENSPPARPPHTYGHKEGNSPLRQSQEREFIRDRREIYHKSHLETEIALLKYTDVEKR